MKGRALTAEQKKSVTNRIYVAWLCCPGMRLGQFIDNATHSFGDLFYAEDEALAEACERFAAKTSAGRGTQSK